MYGTIARIQAKPGLEGQLTEELTSFEQADVPGALTVHLFRMDTDPNAYYMSVVFADKASYVANATSKEQDARYQKAPGPTGRRSRMARWRGCIQLKRQSWALGVRTGSGASLHS
jgi:hypothetical protein